MPVLDRDSSFLTVQQCADLLNVSPDTVRTLVHRGDITGIKIGRQFRINPDLLHKYLYNEGHEIQ